MPDYSKLAAAVVHAIAEQRDALKAVTADRDRLAAELAALKAGSALSLDQWMHRALKAEAELAQARADARMLAIQVAADHGEPPRHKEDSRTVFWHRRPGLAEAVIRATDSAGGDQS